MITSAKIVGENVSYEDYSKQPNGSKRGEARWVMSRSELVAFADNPEKWLDLKESPGTTATDWGSLVECLEMAPDTFESRFIVHPATYPPKDKPWTLRADYCNEWKEERTAAGFIVISPKLLIEAEIAVKATRSYQPRAELIACSRKQVMVAGEVKVGMLKIQVRCLLDLVPDEKHPQFGKAIADSKTARNGNPANFERVIDDEAYDIQAALGLDLYVKATGEDRLEWLLPLQENTAPYHVVKPMPALTAEFLEWGRVKYQWALRYYASCLASNEWPSYAIKGLVLRNVQYLSPENLWSYKQTGGAVASRQDYQPEPQPEREPQGIIP